MSTLKELSKVLAFLTPSERAELDALLASDPMPWRPLPGPQTIANESWADIIGYGGAAGGGKTDLACGKALTQHSKVMILRRVGTELTGIVDRLEELVGNRNGYNGQDKIWKLRRYDNAKLQIEFGALPNRGDERKYQGRPHDLLVFDEASNFLEQQVRFLLGWVRAVDPRQVKKQALLTFNPPTSAEGRWIIAFFAPWLDPAHPNPAKPGELRYAAMLPGPDGNSRDVWVDDATPFVMVNDEMVYNFDPELFEPDEIITPRSRTFIAARIADNPYLLNTGYMAQLQALPEPLRSQMLRGDFMAGMEDSAMQVIPTLWVKAAMARWKKPAVLPPMMSIGIDVARGGKDNTVVARRHEGWWFDVPITQPGTETPNGHIVAGMAITAARDDAPMHIDVIGVGASPFDILTQARQQVLGVNVANKSTGTDKSGRLRFANLRSELWWKMRELLDPAANNGIALPPDPRLEKDLCAPEWTPRGPIIYVESREDIIERIGHSPDWASAYLLAAIETPKRVSLVQLATGNKPKEHDPMAAIRGFLGQ